jgi:hypothetical protein
MASSSNANMLRLGTGVTGTTDTYFVAFRTPINFDVGLPSEARNVVEVSATTQRVGACRGAQDQQFH